MDQFECSPGAKVWRLVRSLRSPFELPTCGRSDDSLLRPAFHTSTKDEMWLSSVSRGDLRDTQGGQSTQDLVSIKRGRWTAVSLTGWMTSDAISSAITSNLQFESRESVKGSYTGL
jgi:hypothetical protein